MSLNRRLMADTGRFIVPIVQALFSGVRLFLADCFGVIRLLISVVAREGGLRLVSNGTFDG